MLAQIPPVTTQEDSCMYGSFRMILDGTSNTPRSLSTFLVEPKCLDRRQLGSLHLTGSQAHSLSGISQPSMMAKLLCTPDANRLSQLVRRIIPSCSLRISRLMKAVISPRDPVLPLGGSVCSTHSALLSVPNGSSTA